MFMAIGASLKGPGAAASAPEDLVEEGQSWWQGQLGKIKSVLCPQIVRLRDAKTELQLIAVVTDLILTHCGYPPLVIPPVAILVATLGVEKLCPGDQEG